MRSVHVVFPGPRRLPRTEQSLSHPSEIPHACCTPLKSRAKSLAPRQRTVAGSSYIPASAFADLTRPQQPAVARPAAVKRDGSPTLAGLLQWRWRFLSEASVTRSTNSGLQLGSASCSNGNDGKKQSRRSLVAVAMEVCNLERTVSLLRLLCYFE
jgi:hypothetical protein